MPGTQRFFDSLANTTPMEHVSVKFTPYYKSSSDYRTILTGVPFPGHFNKWKFVPDNLDPERYVIFSDTTDVVFQGRLPKLEYDLYLAPELVDHRYTMWKEHIEQFPAFSLLMDKEVMNCGTFAMKVKTMYEYRDFIYTFDKDGYGKWPYALEQLMFNMFVYSRHDLSKVIDRTIFCPLFANIYHGVEKRGGEWFDGKQVISCVHANGDANLKNQL